MDALQLLQQRNSASKLAAPAPSPRELADVFAAAARAPDHARLRPWRFRVVEGDARFRLGDLYAEAAKRRNPELSDVELERFRRQPLRAPMLLVVSALVQAHPKVPKIEQLLSAGCAAYASLLALEALGYAGIWRTGDHAFDRQIMAGLGMQENEETLGFLYVGSRDGVAKPLPDLAPSEFVETWTGL